MKILQKLKTNIEDGDLENFEKTILNDNIQRGKILAWMVIVFEALLAVIDTVSFLMHKGMRFQHIQYLSMYMLMIVFNALFLLYYKNFKADNLHPRLVRRHKNSIVIFVTALMCWGSVVTLMDQALYGQVIVFIINVITCSVIFIIDHKKILIPYALSAGILAIGLPFFQPSADILVGHYVNLSFFIIVSWLASRMIYYFYCSDFNSKTSLERSKEQLLHQIELNNTVNDMLTRLNRQLEVLTLSDELTGIPNRRSFRNYIDGILDKITAGNRQFSVILADIDFFKDYNDHYGHAAGDNVLIAVAGKIHQAVRSANDFAARWGGEEFIFATFDTTEPEIESLAQSIRESILKLNIPHAYSKASPFISISLGVCTLPVMQASDISHIINMADNALYLAKTSGRNCVKCHVST